VSSSQDRTTVIVADDHPIFLAALTTVVRRSPRLELVGQAVSGREALELIRQDRPDVAILNLRMPDLDGRQVVQTLTREEIHTRALIISGDISPEDAYGLIEAGAAGLLLTTAGADELTDAVAAVAESNTVLPHELHAGLMRQIRIRSPGEHPLLTRREREILADVARGLSAPEIGRQRSLSTSTVKTYLHQLYEKLGVSDRAAAVAEGMRRGLIE
jgi:two-component system nitrate/nitrite response regulator NarL